jgi:hypothetical protein
MMPAIKYYEVEQTRTIKVSANSIVDAIRVAAEAFDAPKNNEDRLATAPDGIFGNVHGYVEVTRLDVTKEL